MYIRQGGREYRAEKDINRFCNLADIIQDAWDVSGVDEAICLEAARNPEYGRQVIARVQDRLDALKADYGYLTEDVVCLSPETPDLETLLAKFDKEHHHIDDEVRAVLYGGGVFGIAPETGEPFEIVVETGDLIVVPAYTRHWFTLTPERHIVALRVFKTPAGWNAIYEREALAEAK